MKYTKKQEIFDRVAIHLLIQNKKSQRVHNGRKSCLYRDDDGNMCAVGCLISDENYTQAIEGFNVNDSSVSLALGKSLDFKIDEIQQLMSNLQYIHDGEDTDKWSYALIKLATNKDLSIDVVDFANEFKQGMTW